MSHSLDRWVGVGVVAVSIVLGALIGRYGVGTPLVLGLAGALAAALLALMLKGNRLSSLRRPRRLDPLERLALSLLCLAMVSITWNGVRAVPGMSVADALLVGAVAAWVLHVLAQRSAPRDRPPRWLLVPAAVVLFEALLDCLIFEDPLSSAIPGMRFAVALALTPLVIGVIAARLEALWLVVDCWLLSVGVNAAVGCLDYFAGTGISTTITGQSFTDRASGLTTQPNHLAFVVVLALPVVVIRCLQARMGGLRVFYLAVGVLSIAALLASGSRGGLVGGLLALLTVPLFQPAVRRRALIAVGVAMVALVFVMQSLPSSVSFVSLERVTSGSGESQVSVSNSARAANREKAIAEFAGSPLVGVGYERVREAHVIYLQLLAAGGIVGLAAFLAFALGTIATGIRLTRATPVPPEIRGLAGALCGSMIMWLVLGVVENQLFDRYLFVPCGLIIGAAIVSRQTASAPVELAEVGAPANAWSRLPRGMPAR